METSVLIVEDEPAIQELIAYTCESSGMEVRRASNVAEARKMLEAKIPDIILLDWMLPDCSGLEWLKEIRKGEFYRRIPVIMVTARSLEDDKVVGLDKGADDYVVKPFSPKELVARIKAVIRRHGEEETKKETLQCGDLVINPEDFEVTIGNKSVNLSVVEFKILSLFAKHPGRVYSRQQIIDNVWGYAADIDERTVDVHMLRLRKQLAATSMADFIETVRGLGYRAAKQTQDA